MKRVRIKTKDNQIVAGRRYLQQVFDEIKQKDGEYAVEFKKWTGNKTLKQIRAVKGILIPGIAKYTGESKKEVQRRLKEEYGETERFTDSKGNACIEYKSFRYYTKTEMREFLDGALQHAEEDLGFVIDFETRKQFEFDDSSGELIEV